MARKKKRKTQKAIPKKKGGAAKDQADATAGEEEPTPKTERSRDASAEEDDGRDDAGDEEVGVEDVDAVLDDDLDESEDLAALIAQTVAGAEPEDHVAKPLVEPLDDEPVEVIDGEQPAPLPAAADPMDAVGDADSQGTPEADFAVPATPAKEEAADEADLTGAIDLGPVSTPESRDRLLAQTLAHAELQDARYRVPFSDPRRAARWKGAVAALLILVAATVAVAPPAWVQPEPPAELDDTGRARSIRAALLLQAQQVDAYRIRFQRLPDSLDELPHRLPGLRLVKSGNRAFQLIGYEQDGNAIIYDSADPAPEFGRLVPSWLD